MKSRSKERQKKWEVDWEEIEFSCNQEGLLPERKFYKLPKEVLEKAPCRVVERQGSCYSTPDGLYYDPHEGVFVSIYTKNEEA